LSDLEESWPSIVSSVLTEWAVLAGTPVPTEAEIAGHEFPFEYFSKLIPVDRKLERFAEGICTPESLELRYWLLHEYMTIIQEDSVSGEQPLKRARRIVEKLVEIPLGLIPSYGIDLTTKHLKMKQFIQELIEESPRHEIETFLSDVVFSRRIAAQTQRAMGGHLFPDIFLDEDAQSDRDTTEQLKSAFSQVIADWEQLVNLVYGLVWIRKGTEKNWQHIEQVSLLDKVAATNGNSELEPLVKIDWVTLRNSIDHGKAYYDPIFSRIKFADRKNEIQLNISDAQREGSEIALSNHVMLQIFNFVEFAKISNVFKFIEDIEKRIDTAAPGSILETELG